MKYIITLGIVCFLGLIAAVNLIPKSETLEPETLVGGIGAPIEIEPITVTSDTFSATKENEVLFFEFELSSKKGTTVHSAVGKELYNECRQEGKSIPSCHTRVQQHIDMIIADQKLSEEMRLQNEALKTQIYSTDY